jgi:hypothetical protein
MRELLDASKNVSDDGSAPDGSVERQFDETSSRRSRGSA